MKRVEGICTEVQSNPVIVTSVNVTSLLVPSILQYQLIPHC